MLGVDKRRGFQLRMDVSALVQSRMLLGLALTGPSLSYVGASGIVCLIVFVLLCSKLHSVNNISYYLQCMFPERIRSVGGATFHQHQGWFCNDDLQSSPLALMALMAWEA